MTSLLGPAGLASSALLMLGAAAWPEPSDVPASAPGTEASAKATGRHDRLIVPRAPNGMFYVTLRIADAPVRFLVDTGATHVVLTDDDARRIGIDTQAGRRQTLRAAGGSRSVRELTIDSIDWTGGSAKDVGAVVVSGDAGLQTSLLGQSLLRRFEHMRIDREVLTLD